MEAVQVKPKMEFHPKRIVRKGVILFSGGIDSTTLLYDLMNQLEEVYPITFFYGQKHGKEVEMAFKTCGKLGLEYKLVDVDSLGDVAPSALTRDGVEIPMVGYDEESMKDTVVPNRNMVFLSLATAYAIGIGAEHVFYAAHGGDHTLYPDCRPEFVSAMERAIGLCDYKVIHLEAPYMYWDKVAVLCRGIELGVDYSLTWSCYQGGDLACGKCGTCQERLNAFRQVGIKDPIGYVCASCGKEVKEPDVWTSDSQPADAIGLPYHSKCLEEYLV